MTIVWWQFASINVVLYCMTAILAHSMISFGQTLFHRHFGHRDLGGMFSKNHLQFHHAHYAGDHVVSNLHFNNDGNNTPFFLIPTTFVIGVIFFLLRFDFFVVAAATMSLSFFAHVYLDKQYHVQNRGLAALPGSGASSNFILSTTAMPTVILR